MIQSTFGHVLLFSRFVTVTVALLITCTSSSLFAEQVKDTKFAVGRGFYEGVIYDTITTKTEGATIWYTLDGSDPSDENSRRLSTGFDGTSGDSIIVEINPLSTDNDRPFTPGVVIRAFAQAEQSSGLDDTDIDTHTYLFVKEVPNITMGNWKPGSEWPDQRKIDKNAFTPQSFDYRIDPNTVSHYGSESIILSLKSIPSIMLTVPTDSLFDDNYGIYANAWKRKGYNFDDWERSGSIEIITHNDSISEQVNTGVRIRGGYSRHGGNPKHAFRLFFRSEYGDSKFNFPLFGTEGVSKFDKIDLRTAQNHSWSFKGSGNNTFLHDVFSRDLQREMGQPYGRSRYYHLYINGLYWGLYQSEERPEAAFASSYFGGDADDYDVLKVKGRIYENGNFVDYYTLDTEGVNTALYRDLFEKTKNKVTSVTEYYSLQSKDRDGIYDPNGTKLLDPINLADYMIGIYYTGDRDAPITEYQGNTKLNNFYCFINRENPDGFKWIRHDAEHSLDRTGVDKNRTGPFDNTQQFHLFNPQVLHQQLIDNSEYRTLFSDRVYRHFYNNGALTIHNTEELLISRRDEVEGAIIAESARWGDTHISGNGFLSYDDWSTAVDTTLLQNYIPHRLSKVKSQLRDKGWLSSMYPPEVKRNGNKIEVQSTGFTLGETIIFDSPNAIYYTFNGSDPRASRGGIQGILYSSNSLIPIEHGVLKVRSHDGNNWSPLREIQFLHELAPQSLAINEIHYNPFDTLYQGDTEATDETDFQYIELKNTSSEQLNLTGVTFTQGVFYDFPDNTVIEPGELYVIATSIPDFEARYGFKPHGWMKGELSKRGEPLVIKDWLGTIVDSVSYLDDSPWNAEADGEGLSLIRIDPTTGANDPLNWTASKQFSGSPNVENSTTVAPSPLQNVKLSEIHYHPKDSGLVDDDEYEFLEFYNTSDQELSLKDLRFTSGVNYWFPDITIKPDSFYVIASNATEFTARYGFAPHAEYTKGLSNSGESICLRDGLGNLISRVDYTDSLPWSPLADGSGNSLEITLLTDTTNTAFHGNWGASFQIHGTPGALPAPPKPPSYTLTYKPGIKNIFGSLIIDGDTNTTDVTITLEQDLITDSIKALPNYGYRFDGWTDGSMQNPRVDTATAEFSVITKFVPLDMQVTYTALTGGTLTGTPAQTIPYLTQTTVVTATADPHYTFIQWSDGLTTATRNDTALVMDTTITAEFTLNLFDVTLQSAGNGTISPTVDTTIISGSTIALTAVPHEHYHFTHWDVTEGLSVIDANTSSTSLNAVLSNGTVTGHFTADTYTVTYATKQSNGTINGTTKQTITAFEATSSVTAVPQTGLHFVSWSDGSIANPRSDSAFYKDTTFTANFSRNNYTLTIILGTFDTIVQTIPHGSGLRMSATSSPQHTFSGWTATEGITLSDPDSLIVNLTNITESATVTAHFISQAFEVNYSASNGGTVTGEKTQLVQYGSNVSSVTAVPDPGYTFLGWSDGLTDNPRTDMNINHVLNINALFEQAAATDPDVLDPTQPNDTIIGDANPDDTLSTPLNEFSSVTPLTLTLQKLYDSRTLVTLGGDNIEGAQLQVFTIDGTMITTLTSERDLYVIENSALSYELPSDDFAPGLYIVSAQTLMSDGSQKFISRQLRIK
ncbi:MAG: lamin tail domain-containing protein [Fibrobacterales bacterium]